MEGGREVLLPGVDDGRVVNARQAFDRYRQTGRNLGIFDTPEHADMYAEALHRAQARYYGLE